MKYNDAHDFREDLEKRLSDKARSTEELKDLKLQIITDRILARFDTSELIVEGGAATKYHVPPTAYTKDIDALISTEVVKQHGLDKMDLEQRAEFLQGWVNDRLAESKGDFLRLRTDQASPITDLREGDPCIRVWITAEIDKREFLPLFEMDLALQDKPIPTVTVSGRDHLDFADVEKPEIQVMCPEYLIANKLTLYLRESHNPNFERPNDIAHIAALIERVDLDQDRLSEGLAEFACRRDVVNELIERIPDPDYERQEDQFKESLTEQSKIDLSMKDAIQLIRDTIEPVRGKAFELAREKQREAAEYDLDVETEDQPQKPEPAPTPTQEPEQIQERIYHLDRFDKDQIEPSHERPAEPKSERGQEKTAIDHDQGPARLEPGMERSTPERQAERSLGDTIKGHGTSSGPAAPGSGSTPSHEGHDLERGEGDLGLDYGDLER